MSRAWDALQRLTQNVTTVTRSARVDIVGGGVDEIDPPEDLDEYAELARNTGVINKNLRQFTNDVWEPGYRVEAESEETVDFFTGGDNAPEDTPEGGFLENAAVFAGERHQDFYSFGKECTWQRWARGTVTIELLREDPSDPDSRITGFHFIRPETLYPQVQNNTNILLPADQDDLPEDVSERDITLTDKGEVAAYIQFDDESILGLRNSGFSDKTEVPLSQNDVIKQVLDADIGDDFGSETQGVFGTSVIAGIAEDVEEYKQIKRDRARAIQTKAYGIWGIEYGREVLDLGTEKRLIEWDEGDMDADTAELEGLGPGEIATWDGTKDLKRFDSDVPDLEETIKQYISIITAPLPTPKYLVGFAGDINRDISTEQKTGYDDLKSEERRYQHTSWTDALKQVAESWGLDTAGLELKVEEREESNPIKAWDSGQMERASTYISSLAEAAGPQAGPTALVDRDAILEVLDFPVDEIDASAADDALAELQSELESGEEREAWADVLNVEALDGWNPSEHPRNPENGKFTEKPGSAIARELSRIGQEARVGAEPDEGVSVIDFQTDIPVPREIASSLNYDRSTGNYTSGAVRFGEVDINVSDAPFGETRAQNLAGEDWRGIVERAEPPAGVEPDTGDFQNTALHLRVEDSVDAQAMNEFLARLTPLVEQRFFPYDPTIENDEALSFRFVDGELEALAQYSEGDEVDTPAGPGVVVEIRTEDFDGPDGSVEASEDSPTYVIGVEDGVRFYKASDITSGEIDADVDDPEEALAAAGDIAAATDYDALQDGFFEFPESWEESETPARLILLKAWAGLGGRFTSCRREMAGEISRPEAFCADMKDRVLGGWEGWRQGG